jgi:ATP-dependent RNA helicase DHX37/DHR1
MHIHCCVLQGLLVKYGGPSYDPQSLVVLSIYMCVSNYFIMQVETLKEKRRRAMQLSKAGLDVPEELSLFKRNGDQKFSENSDPVEHSLPPKFVVPVQSEDPGRVHEKNMKSDSRKAMECQPKMDVGVSISDPKTEEPSDDGHLLANQKFQSSSLSCSGSELDLQVINLHIC